MTEWDPDISPDSPLLDLKPYYQGLRDSTNLIQIGTRINAEMNQDIDSLISLSGFPFNSKSKFAFAAMGWFTQVLLYQRAIEHPALSLRLMAQQIQADAVNDQEWTHRRNELMLAIHDVLTNLLSRMAVPEITERLGHYATIILKLKHPYWMPVYARDFTDLTAVKLCIRLLEKLQVPAPMAYKEVINVANRSGTNLQTVQGLPSVTEERANSRLRLRGISSRQSEAGDEEPFLDGDEEAGNDSSNDDLAEGEEVADTLL